MILLLSIKRVELYGCTDLWSFMEQTKYGSNDFLQTIVTYVFRNLSYKPATVSAADCMMILIGGEGWSGRKYWQAV